MIDPWPALIDLCLYMLIVTTKRRLTLYSNLALILKLDYVVVFSEIYNIIILKIISNIGNQGGLG